jgi:hypothetical protein
MNSSKAGLGAAFAPGPVLLQRKTGIEAATGSTENFTKANAARD